MLKKLLISCVLITTSVVAQADSKKATWCVVDLQGNKPGNFICHAYGLEQITVEDLYAKGWKIIQVVVRPSIPAGSVVYIEEQ